MRSEIERLVLNVFEALAIQRRPVPFMRFVRENKISISDMNCAMHWLKLNPAFGIRVQKKNGCKFLSIEDSNDLTLAQVKRMVGEDIEKWIK